ncbi:MAG: hypothetical protein ACOX7K_07580 [Oscillospiraceae bacterium]|jgi:hypothetical protein
MYRLKSAFFTSLIVFVSLVVLYLFISTKHIFWGSVLFTLCIIAAYPLYYEKLTEHPNLIIALSTPFVLVYGIVASLIRYAVAGKLVTEAIGPICMMVLLYTVLFMVIYSVLYAVVAYLLRRFNF